jgi:ABC-type transport system involved in multi-copper enzyme maturation permease subunit
MPVLIKEFRALLRGSRAALLITIYVGLALIAMRLVYNSVASAIGSGPPLFNAQIGQSMFIGLSLAVQTLTTFVAPATTVNSISSEHERRTFELLLATPIAATQVLIGKLIAALAFLGLLLVSVFPLYSIVVLFGGVGFIDIARILVTITLTAITGCMLGLICSIVTRQTYSATLLCYVLLVALIGGTIFASNLYSVVRAAMPAPPVYLATNPLAAMASALGRTTLPPVLGTETIQPLVILSLLSEGTLAIDRGRLVGLPTYRVTWTIYTGVSLLLFWLSIHAIQPTNRWRLSRVDTIMLGLFVIYGLFVWFSRDWWLAGLRLPQA